MDKVSTESDFDELRNVYKEKLVSLGRAKDRLKSILREAVTTIEDKKLVRASRPAVRIKELGSLRLKSEKNGWGVGETFSRCGDLIGGRVVCNNLEDVYRFCELVKESLPTYPSDPLAGIHIKDYIKEPDAAGYRALHIYFRLDVSEHPFRLDFVPCEVQIRTRLQDAWAELSHEDIYKQMDLPEGIRARSKDLAEVLSTADKIASSIRSQAVEEIAPPPGQADLSCVTDEGLAHSFREVFGRSPAHYMVRLALDLCERLRITKLEELPKQLVRPGFRERVSEKYQSILESAIRSEDFFLAALYATARGDDKALMWVQREARRERRELEEFAVREALASLPHSIEELLEKLEGVCDESYIIEWAGALGAVSACELCNAAIVDPYSFAESVVKHYEVSGPDADANDYHERIETAIESSGVETGGLNGLMCRYDADQWARPD